MKKCFMLLVVCATMGTCFAQIHDKADFREQIVAATDSLSEEQKEVLFSLFEDMMISRVDSVKNEGRFMQALELTDSMLAKAKTMMRRNPSPRMYITKMIILMQLEEWRDLSIKKLFVHMRMVPIISIRLQTMKATEICYVIWPIAT